LVLEGRRCSCRVSDGCVCLGFRFRVCMRAAAQEQKKGMGELALGAATLAEMISLIEDGTISGKIGKDILPDLLKVLPRSLLSSGSRCRAGVPFDSLFFCGPQALGLRPP
jgi:hypothetical protein